MSTVMVGNTVTMIEKAEAAQGEGVSGQNGQLRRTQRCRRSMSGTPGKPLQWWRVTLGCPALPDGRAEAFVVRHPRTGTDYLEVMGNMRFRDGGGRRKGFARCRQRSARPLCGPFS